MDKKERQRAIQAELERRAAGSGVPPELQVYIMEGHFDGGPRKFVPVKESEDLYREERDRSLWPRLFQSALQEGAPIELALDDSPMYRSGRTPAADLCSWGRSEDYLLIVSERANGMLEPFLRQTCRPVPVTCATARLFGYQLVAVEDVLDFDQCECGSAWEKKKRNCYMDFVKYAMHASKLGPTAIFRTPEHKDRILVLQAFVDVVQKHQLTGFKYKRVWPHSAMPPIVTTEVKKLPRSEADSRRDPQLSTDAKEIDAGFVNELLGGPLTEEGSQPFELVAYRLPELSVPSGVMVAADLLFSEGKPFARRVNPGKYPVILIAARFKNDERIAFALVQLGQSPVASWEAATTERMVGSKSRKTDTHCYAVDSGTGGFCDSGAQQSMRNLADPEDSQTKRIEKAMSKVYRHTRSWVHVETETGSMAIFSSGYGDGEYPSYFGLDAAGEPVVLMTDFGVLVWGRDPEVD